MKKKHLTHVETFCAKILFSLLVLVWGWMCDTILGSETGMEEKPCEAFLREQDIQYCFSVRHCHVRLDY